MNRIIIIISIFICNWSFCQEHSSLFQSKTVKQNNVYKVLEYDPKDSIRFFEKYPDGYYSKYDKLGRMTESNHYSSYENAGVWHPNMFTNYYLYDSLDNQIAFVQIYDDMESPFRYLEVRSFNESDTIKIARLNEISQLNSEFLFDVRIKNAKSPFWGDTLKISKRHSFLKGVNDTTITMDIYFDKNGLRDSTILKSIASGSEGKYKSENINTFEYYKNGKLKSVFVKHFQVKKSKELFLIEQYYFLENELLDKMMTYYTINETWDVRKFKYFIRNVNTPKSK